MTARAAGAFTGGFGVREHPLASLTRDSLLVEGGTPVSAASGFKQPAETPQGTSPLPDRQPDVYSPEETQRVLRMKTLTFGEEEVVEVNSSVPLTPTQHEVEPGATQKREPEAFQEIPPDTPKDVAAASDGPSATQVPKDTDPKTKKKSMYEDGSYWKSLVSF